MGRPLFVTQIHQKNIWKLSKLHKTTSECRQRTSGTQKSSPLPLKGGRKKCKRQKKTKVIRMELHPGKGVLKREKFPNTRKHSHCWVCGEPCLFFTHKRDPPSANTGKTAIWYIPLTDQVPVSIVFPHVKQVYKRRCSAFPRHLFQLVFFSLAPKLKLSGSKELA